MKNSVAILSHLKAHKRKEPIYERTLKGIIEATGLSNASVGSAITRLRKAGCIAPNPSKMLVGKHPNGTFRGNSRPNAWDITKEGIEWLEVRT